MRVRHVCPHISGTECVGFSKQDACGNLVADSLPVIFPFLPLAEGFGVNIRWANANHTFLLTKILKLHFLV
jgi:hypothetical protein